MRLMPWTSGLLAQIQHPHSCERCGAVAALDGFGDLGGALRFVGQVQGIAEMKAGVVRVLEATLHQAPLHQRDAFAVVAMHDFVQADMDYGVAALRLAAQPRPLKDREDPSDQCA